MLISTFCQTDYQLLITGSKTIIDGRVGGVRVKVYEGNRKGRGVDGKVV